MTYLDISYHVILFHQALWQLTKMEWTRWYQQSLMFIQRITKKKTFVSNDAMIFGIFGYPILITN